MHLTSLLLAAIIAQGPVIAWPRVVPNPARLDAPQPTQAVEVVEHFFGTIQQSTTAKNIVWVLPAGLRIDTRKLGDGKSLYVTGSPGTYTLYEVAIDDKGTAQQFERTVIVKADGPTPVPPDPLPPNPAPPNPGPAPNPTPTPTPPTPVPVPPVPTPPSPPGPGKYGVATLVYDSAMKLPPDAKAKTPAVCAAFKSLSSAIAAGGIPLLSVAGETRRQLDVVYGSDPKIRNAWLAMETAAIAKLKPQIKLNAQDVSTAYGEIALGLEAVR